MRTVLALLVLGAAAGAARADMLSYSINAINVGGGGTGSLAPLFESGAPVRITLQFDAASGPLDWGGSAVLPGRLAFEVQGVSFALSDPTVRVAHYFNHEVVLDPTAEGGMRPVHHDVISFTGTGVAPLPGPVETTHLSLQLAYLRNYPHWLPTPEHFLTDLALTRPEDGYATLYGFGWLDGEHTILAGLGARPRSIRATHAPEPGALVLAAAGASLALLARCARRRPVGNAA